MSNIPQNYIINKNVKLIHGKWELKKEQMKVVLLLQRELQKNPDKDIITININELARLLDTKHKGIKGYLKKVTKEIMGKVIEIEDETFKQFHIISSTEYTDNHIHIRIDPSLKPYLLSEGEALNILYGMKMKSLYSIRLFEILNVAFKEAQEHEMKIEFELSKLRYKLNLENKLLKFNHFKERVLDKAVKEINELTYFHVEYRAITYALFVEMGDSISITKLDSKVKKTGKTVVAIRFVVRKQDNSYLDKIENEMNLLESPAVSEKPQLIKSEAKKEVIQEFKKIGININNDKVQEVIKEKTDKDILKALKIVKKDILENKKILNIQSYTLGVIANTTYSEYEEIRDANKKTNDLKSKNQKEATSTKIEDEESKKIADENNKILNKYNKLSEEEKISIIEKAITELEQEQFSKQILKKFMSNELIRETDISKYDKIIQTMLIKKIGEIL